MQNKIPCILPLAGMGSRFFPVTKSLPKEMLPLMAKPCVQYSIEDGMEAGSDEMVFVLPGCPKSNYKKSLDHYFNYWSSPFETILSSSKGEPLRKVKELSDSIHIHKAYQEKALGLGHAVLQGKSAIDELGADKFFVLLPDDIIDSKPSSCSKLLDRLEAEDAQAAILVQEIAIKDSKRYGIIKGSPSKISSDTFLLDSLVEKPEPSDAPSNLAVVGRYLLPKSILEVLESTPSGSGGEIQLTDALNELCKKERTIAVKLDGQRLDTGTPLGFNLACLWFGMKDPEQRHEIKKFLKNIQGSTDN